MGIVKESYTVRLLLLTCLQWMFCCFLVNAQDTNEIITWSETPLLWTDFREDNSVPDKYGNHAAKSHWRLEFILDDKVQDSPAIRVSVRALFLPEQSWVSKKTIGNTKVLMHEQIHFDLTELYARLLRKELLSTHFTKKHYRRKIKRARRKIMTVLREAQADYDADTRHGTNFARQEWWMLHVRRQLSETSHLRQWVIPITIIR